MALSRPILVVLRALGLGDLLTTVPALRAVADAFPDHRRILATTAPMLGLAALTATVDHVIAVEPLATLPRWIERPDVAVNLHGRGPQSHRVLLGIRPGRLIAFANDAVGVAGPRWRPGEHEVVRWCRLLTESGMAADPRRLRLDPPAAWAAPGSGANVASPGDGATVIHPGAASPARRWPAPRWAEVAAAEAGAGRMVLITGSASEVEGCRRITASAGLPPGACLAGTTDVVGLAAVVASAGIVLSADSGVAHLATALGRPSVVLFGPTPPAEWGPPTCDRHVALWAGRSGDPHGDHVDPGLLAISVDDVLAAARSLRARLAGVI